jgi:hypothetical protein
MRGFEIYSPFVPEWLQEKYNKNRYWEQKDYDTFSRKEQLSMHRDWIRHFHSWSVAKNPWDEDTLDGNGLWNPYCNHSHLYLSELYTDPEMADDTYEKWYQGSLCLWEFEIRLLKTQKKESFGSGGNRTHNSL